MNYNNFTRNSLSPITNERKGGKYTSSFKSMSNMGDSFNNRNNIEKRLSLTPTKKIHKFSNNTSINFNNTMMQQHQ